jgi:hypothetical protein
LVLHVNSLDGAELISSLSFDDMSSQFRSRHRCEASKDAGLAELAMIRERMAGRWKNLSRFPVAAFLVPALHATASLLADFFDEEGGAAGRTSLGNGTVPQGKFAGRIFAAGKERTAFARPLLDKVTAAPRLGTFHTEG